MTELEAKLQEIEARTWKPIGTKSRPFEAYTGWDTDTKGLIAALRLAVKALEYEVGAPFAQREHGAEILRALKGEAS